MHLVKPRMNITTKRIIIALALIVIIAFGVFAGYGIYEGNRVKRMIMDDVHKNEMAFQEKPNLLQSLVLMDNYYWDYKEYDKANYYAAYSIKLGVEQTPRGWYVHMVKADIASKNKKIDEACHDLSLALQMARQYKISENNIKTFTYQELLNTCTAKGIK